ncbi:MAG: adenylosuccinate lyase [Ignavibacteria bacterium]|jgi:adenylosuccinate lyase|nr:adenylosuccinate lyase [Ignavibacteria bacterium]
MIQRYTSKDIAPIWSDENRFSVWLKIEILACEAQNKLGLVPNDALENIQKKAKFNVERILEIEETVKHDVIAFLTNVEEYVGDSARYIHFGMTSSDILDTCFAYQCKQAAEIILKKLEKFQQVLAKRAIEFKHTICVGRTHGIHAEPTTFGLKLALWFEECKRNIERMKFAIDEVSVGKINGAVGTFEHISPTVEEYVCEKMGLRPAPVTNQVIQRDRFANLLTTIALAGSFLEKIATEIRHLQRTEVLEAEEYFSKGQKGSSAMPHKKNPIVSEQICGLARLLRSNAMAAVENNALWHERDISHSSVERVIFPDSTILIDYLLNKTISLVENLVVHEERMKENLDLTKGLIYSQKLLLKLAEKGIPRQEAYYIVQDSAMLTWKENIHFLNALLENQKLMNILTKEEIEALFKHDEIFKNVDYIFKRLRIE